MLSGINKRCSGCRKKCKQFKQITIVECPNYESRKILNTQKVHLDLVRESPEVACEALKMAQRQIGSHELLKPNMALY